MGVSDWETRPLTFMGSSWYVSSICSGYVGLLAEAVLNVPRRAGEGLIAFLMTGPGILRAQVTGSAFSFRWC